jgi:hypothetical protein
MHMYRLGRGTHKKIKRKLWLGIVLVLVMLFGAGGFFTVQLLHESEPSITTPKAITREYAPEAINDSKAFDQQLFTVSLPNDWLLKEHTTEPYNLYSFQATKKNADNRFLEIYVDKLPPDRPYNRLMPVSVDNNKIIVTGSVSDNCTTFTGPQGANQAAAPKVDSLPAKWQGVDFKCDMANYSRNVVGVGAAAAGSKLPLLGATSGKHTFYFIYIDHNVNPDYQILEEALSSLTLK